MGFINVIPAFPSRHKVSQQCIIIGDFKRYFFYLVVVEYLVSPQQVGKEELVFEIPRNGKVSKFELYLDDSEGWVLRYNVDDTVEIKGEKFNTIVTKTILPKPGFDVCC